MKKQLKQKQKNKYLLPELYNPVQFSELQTGKVYFTYTSPAPFSTTKRKSK
jgi:hypothetical protein